MDDSQQAMIMTLLNRRFDSVEAGLERVDARIDVLAEQVREANWRTSKNESAIAGLNPHVETLRREMRDTKQDLAHLKRPNKEEDGENRPIKAWHVWYGLACVALTITVLKFLGRL